MKKRIIYLLRDDCIPEGSGKFENFEGWDGYYFEHVYHCVRHCEMADGFYAIEYEDGRFGMCFRIINGKCPICNPPQKPSV